MAARFKPLDKPIKVYDIDQVTQKHRGVCSGASYCICTGENRTKETSIKKFNQKNSKSTYSEFIVSVKKKNRLRSPRTVERAFEGCFLVLTGIWKSEYVSISYIEDIAFEQAIKCLEARTQTTKKQKLGKGQRMSEENINLPEKYLFGISNSEALLNTVWLFTEFSAFRFERLWRESAVKMIKSPSHS